LKFNRSVIRFLAPCLYNLINLVFCVQFTLLKLLIWASSLPNYESAFYNFVIKVRQPKKFKIKRCQTFAITSRKMRISRQRTDIFFTLRLAIYKEHRFLLIFQRMIIILSWTSQRENDDNLWENSSIRRRLTQAGIYLLTLLTLLKGSCKQIVSPKLLS
jgi:hypothetical protein